MCGVKRMADCAIHKYKQPARKKYILKRERKRNKNKIKHKTTMGMRWIFGFKCLSQFDP